MTLPRPVAALASGSDTALDEFESKRQLAAHGLSIPDGELGSAADAAAIADRIGYPVVVKAVGSNFLHKSDLGAVAVNLADSEAVNQAVAHISESCASHNVVAERFLVERMVESPVAELIVGMKRDEQFGPALVVGSGGILVELVADSRSLLLPVTRDAVRKAIDSLAVSKLINAYRGGVQGDIDALVDAVMSVAAYAEEHWSTLLELDVNPLMVLPTGKGTVAADALIVLRTSA
jgi:acyl-CoA synthetase (NDP forming)